MGTGSGTRPLADEIGDLLFAVVNVARKAGVQPGPALDRTNGSSGGASPRSSGWRESSGIDMHTAGLEVLDGLWDEVKRMSV